MFQILSIEFVQCLLLKTANVSSHWGNDPVPKARENSVVIFNYAKWLIDAFLNWGFTYTLRCSWEGRTGPRIHEERKRRCSLWNHAILTLYGAHSFSTAMPIQQHMVYFIVVHELWNWYSISGRNHLMATQLLRDLDHPSLTIHWQKPWQISCTAYHC